MLFKPFLIDKIIAGQKTQTRRLVTQHEEWTHDDKGRRVQIATLPICQYKVGKDYAVCPGRGKPMVYFNPRTGETNAGLLEDCKASGMNISIWGGAASSLYGYVPLRIRITSIRREDVREISTADAKAEGFAKRLDFLHVWCSMHDPAFAKQFNDYREMVFERGHGGETTGGIDESFRIGTFNADILKLPRERYDAWALTFEVKQDYQ